MKPQGCLHVLDCSAPASLVNQTLLQQFPRYTLFGRLNFSIGPGWSPFRNIWLRATSLGGGTLEQQAAESALAQAAEQGFPFRTKLGVNGSVTE